MERLRAAPRGAAALVRLAAERFQGALKETEVDEGGKIDFHFRRVAEDENKSLLFTSGTVYVQVHSASRLLLEQ